MAKDKELADHERAHSGQPGAKVRHGADATGKPGKRRQAPAWGSQEWAETRGDDLGESPDY